MSDLLLCIVGPTGSGKTTTAIEIAERVGGEIVSADARQVYRRLDIGTAKPTAEERARAAHHVVDTSEPDEVYHAARFVDEAEAAIAEIRRRGKRPIVAGGTGLYVRALTRGLDVRVGRHPDLRASLEARADEEGLGALHDELARVDPESAAAIHRNDRIRIVRALEIFLVSGETRTEQHRRGAGVVRHRSLLAGLAPPRDELCRRIDERFDAMMAAGFVAEVRSLLDEGLDPDLPCFRSPGYREMIAHLREGLPLDEAVLRGKREHRRYAKRQMTWFRAEDVRWFGAACGEGEGSIAERIVAEVEKIESGGSTRDS